MVDIEVCKEVAQRLRDRSGYLREHSEAADTIDALVLEVERLTKVDVEPVAWGVDWGRYGDRTCVSIIKKYSDGAFEVLATEYEPNPSPALAAEQAKVRELATHLDRVLQHAMATSRNVIYTAKRAGEVHAMYTDARAAIAKYGEQK